VRALLVNVGHGQEPADPHPRHHVAPMDLAQCAAILEADGWRVELWDTVLTPSASSAEIEARVRHKAPDLLIVRPLHASLHVAEQLLRSQAGTTALRLAMGPLVPHIANDLLADGELGRAADGAIVGEPEPTLIDLLPHLREGRLPASLAGLRTRAGEREKPRAFLKDLDSLPIPAQHLLVGRGYRFRYPLDVDGPLHIGYVLTSRGCALGCIFCAPVERETFGTKYRFRSADHVVDELLRLRELGANAVYFIDDFFGFSPRRIRDLCEAMIARDAVMPWCAQIRAQGISLDLLRLMRRAGCSTLCFGAESGSDRVLGLLRKGVTVAEVREQAARIRHAGIQLVGYFIVGVPGETDAERQTTYDFIEEIAPDLVQLHIFNVFPGAPAMDMFPERYVEEGTKFTGPRGLDQRMIDLDRERRSFYRRYYLSPRYLGRALRRRWRPLLHNFGEEAEFVVRTTRFFLERP
jgi:anaerobic magnesium-protoporphyrin IX monomethyl ester cyclase